MPMTMASMTTMLRMRLRQMLRQAMVKSIHKLFFAAAAAAAQVNDCSPAPQGGRVFFKKIRHA